MFTTLLDDQTDTLYESGLDTIKQLPPRFASFPTEISTREHFNDLAISSVTLGDTTAMGTLTFNAGASGGVYVLQNQNGVLKLLHSDTATSTQNNFMSLSGTGDFTLVPLQKTTNTNDTVDLIPVVVDANGKIQRGYELYQSINANLTQLNSRVGVLESTSAPVLSSQINSRLSDLETLGQKIRVRINGMNIFSDSL